MSLLACNPRQPKAASVSRPARCWPDFKAALSALLHVWCVAVLRQAGPAKEAACVAAVPCPALPGCSDQQQLHNAARQGICGRPRGRCTEHQPAAAAATRSAVAAAASPAGRRRAVGARSCTRPGTSPQPAASTGASS